MKRIYIIHCLYGKSVPPFQPTVSPLSPPLKSGSTIPPDSLKATSHQAASTTATHTLEGVLIPDKYKTIPPLA